MSSQSEAQGDANGLRRILIAGNRACAFVILPISASLIILGKSIIEVWVGARYIEQSYPVLLVLIIPFTLMLAQGASGRMLIGTSQHGAFGVVTLLEGAANVILSVVLVRPYGILGDALGTTIPLLCTVVLFLPRHACRRFGIGVSTFIREAYTLPLVITLPLVVVMLLEQHWYIAHHAAGLALQFLLAWGIYGACFLWIYKRKWAFQVDQEACRHKLSQSPNEGSLRKEMCLPTSKTKVRDASGKSRSPLGPLFRKINHLRCKTWELVHCVDTSGDIPLTSLDFSSEHKSPGLEYQSHHPKILLQMLSALDIDHEQYGFIDYGCGKGAELLVAAEFPFRWIVGVEFAP
jgi:hypothetical protein